MLVGIKFDIYNHSHQSHQSHQFHQFHQSRQYPHLTFHLSHMDNHYSHVFIWLMILIGLLSYYYYWVIIKFLLDDLLTTSFIVWPLIHFINRQIRPIWNEAKYECSQIQPEMAHNIVHIDKKIALGAYSENIE